METVVMGTVPIYSLLCLSLSSDSAYVLDSDKCVPVCSVIGFLLFGL